jgi:hypothetical protein
VEVDFYGYNLRRHGHMSARLTVAI